MSCEDSRKFYLCAMPRARATPSGFDSPGAYWSSTALPTKRRTASPARLGSPLPRAVAGSRPSSTSTTAPAAKQQSAREKSDLAAWGLPVGAPAPKSFAPASPLVGASCLLFGLCGLHGFHNGDLMSAVLALLVTLNSFTADYVNNVPDLVPALTRSRVCACDRACATAYSLWLVRVAVFQLGPTMLLTLVPLVLVLSYSRGSQTRNVWILRHSFWHLFCVAECLCIMQVRTAASVAHLCRPLSAKCTEWRCCCRPHLSRHSPPSPGLQAVYHSDESGALRHELGTREGVLRLALGPVGVGLVLAIHGLRGAAADAAEGALAAKRHCD